MSDDNDAGRGTPEATKVLTQAYEAILAARDACTEENSQDYVIGLEDASDIVLKVLGTNSATPNTDAQGRGFRDAAHEEASRAACGIADPSDIVTEEPRPTSAPPISRDEQARILGYRDSADADHQHEHAARLIEGIDEPRPSKATPGHTCDVPGDSAEDIENVSYDLRCAGCIALRIAIDGPMLRVGDRPDYAPDVEVHAIVDAALEVLSTDMVLPGIAAERRARLRKALVDWGFSEEKRSTQKRSDP